MRISFIALRGGAWYNKKKETTGKVDYIMNRLLYRDIKPQGWLRRQLEIQAAGLSGHLDKIWPDVRDSAWIGGDREGWERVPYWLDGFIPLAHLLEDEDLIARAKKYIQAIVDRQQPDGWICPCTQEERKTYDAWAVLLIGKVLALHCEFTQDQKVEDALYRTMKNLHELLAAGEIALFNWGKFRWYEGIVPLLHLYARRPEDWMLDLGRLLRAQGANYPDFVETWKTPLNKWTYHTHIVNLCMMFKYEAVACALLGDEYTNEAEKLWQVLEEYNGTAVGTFTGDECLAGHNNNRGTELCSVVELMYACEWVYSVTGDPTWAERVEKAAFNALPATMTEDMWAHQYDQQVNQVACIKLPHTPVFGTNSGESHLFGLEPNYGCCTANMHQGWPKLALAALQGTEEGFLLAHLLPVSAETAVDGKPVKISVETEYPFRLSACITVEAEAAFELRIRIPSWAKNVCLNGQSPRIRQGHVTLKKAWSGAEKIELTMEAVPHFVTRPHGLKVVEYGPMVYSLPIETEYRRIEYERNGVERVFPYCDYELIPHSAWNYGFDGAELTVEERGVSEVPFSAANPPVVIEAKLAKVDWPWEPFYDSVAAVKPASTLAVGESEHKELIPYGCARLRMTEMPRVRR